MKSNYKLPYQLTSQERQAMKKEIISQIIEYDDKYSMDSDATVLWALHICFGFGKKRLEQFWECCFAEHEKLRNYYELDINDGGWLYTKKLKDIGVDIEQLYADAVRDGKRARK